MMAAYDDEVTVIDLVALAHTDTTRQPVWACVSADLNVNLLVFDSGTGVTAHVNDEVDVLLVGIAGEGVVEVDGVPRPLRTGQAVVIPRGARRAIHSAGGHFAYLTGHRRRGGLWPHGVPRLGEHSVRVDQGQGP